MYSNVKVILFIASVISFIGCSKSEVTPTQLKTIATLDNYPARLGVYQDYDGSPESYDVEFYLRLIDHPEYENLVLPDQDTLLAKLLFYQSLHPSVGEEVAEGLFEQVNGTNRDTSLDYEFSVLRNFQNPYIYDGGYEDLMIFHVSGEIKERTDGFYQNELNAYPFVASEITKRAECEVNSDDRSLLTDLLLDESFRILGVNYEGDFYYPTCEKNVRTFNFSTDSAEANHVEDYYKDGKDWRFFNFSTSSCRKDLYHIADGGEIILKPYHVFCPAIEFSFSKDELLFDIMFESVLSDETVTYAIEDSYIYLTNPKSGDRVIGFLEE